MVETIYIHKIIKELEKYFIRKNSFHLFGNNYDLILFVPSDKYSAEGKLSLIVSAQIFNNLNQKEVIRELLNEFKRELELDEYNSITRLNIVHSDDSFVKNLKYAFGFREEIIEINNVLIGGVNIDFAYIAKSLILDKLIENKTLTLEVISDNGMIEKVNAGIRRIDENYDVVYYTSKGLREIYSPEMTEKGREDAKFIESKSEDFLISNHFISKINLNKIIKVV